MLFGLIKEKHYITLEEMSPSASLTGFSPQLKIPGQGKKSFAFESLISPVVFDTALDPLGAKSEVKGLSFTCLLLDDSQYGNYQLWDTEVTKEEKLKHLHDLFEATDKSSKKKKSYHLVNEALNHLGIKEVRLSRLQSRLEQTQITVVVSLSVVNSAQEKLEAKKGAKLADGSQAGQIKKALVLAKSKNSSQKKKDEGLIQKIFSLGEEYSKKLLG